MRHELNIMTTCNFMRFVVGLIRRSLYKILVVPTKGWANPKKWVLLLSFMLKLPYPFFKKGNQENVYSTFYPIKTKI